MTIRIHKTLIRQELLSPSTILGSVTIMLAYLALSTLLLNTRLLSETLSGGYPWSYKFGIVSALFMGVTTMYTPIELFVLFALGLLMGLNLVLVVRMLRQQRQKKGVASLGLGMFGVVASTGCASCGLTLFSFAAPTVSLSLAPFQGPLLQGVSLVLLTVSLFHTLNRKAAVCTITR